MLLRHRRGHTYNPSEDNFNIDGSSSCIKNKSQEHPFLLLGCRDAADGYLLWRGHLAGVLEEKEIVPLQNASLETLPVSSTVQASRDLLDFQGI